MTVVANLAMTHGINREKQVVAKNKSEFITGVGLKYILRLFSSKALPQKFFN